MKPRESRMVALDVAGRVIRRQPPVRVRYCLPPAKPEGAGCVQASALCHGTEATCASCGFRYCATHRETHLRGLAVPPDAWRSVVQQLVNNLQAAAQEPTRLHATPPRPALAYRVGRVVDDKPPVVVEQCKPPSRKDTDKPCVFPTTKCHGAATVCDSCYFPRCAKHHGGHRRRFVLPRRVWLKLVARFQRELDREAGPDRRGMVRVHVPPWREWA